MLGLRAKNCNTGNILDQEQAQAARREDVLELSEPDRSQVQNPGGRIACYGGKALHAALGGDDTVTRSPQGLQHRNEGGRIRRDRRGHTFFPACCRNRPEIRDGLREFGACYSGMGESVLSAESTTKAWQLRDRVSDRERFFIDFLYDRQVTGNLEKAYQTLESWYQTYPRGGESPSPQGLLAGLATHGTGRFERAIEMAQKTIAAHPDVVLRVRQSCVQLFLPRPLRRSREHSSASCRTQAGDNPNHLVMPIQHRCVKG